MVFLIEWFDIGSKWLGIIDYQCGRRTEICASFVIELDFVCVGWALFLYLLTSVLLVPTAKHSCLVVCLTYLIDGCLVLLMFEPGLWHWVSLLGHRIMGDSLVLVGCHTFLFLWHFLTLHPYLFEVTLHPQVCPHPVCCDGGEQGELDEGAGGGSVYKICGSITECFCLVLHCRLCKTCIIQRMLTIGACKMTRWLLFYPFSFLACSLEEGDWKED